MTKRGRNAILPYRFWPMYLRPNDNYGRFYIHTRNDPIRADFQKRAPGVVEMNEYVLREYQHLPDLVRAG